MSHRIPDPRTHDMEDVLRRALRTAADSVEPAADGLERIRARISDRRQAPASWALADSSGPAGFLLRGLRPIGTSLQAAGRLVVRRFGPNPNGAGRYGWLRPAAAMATGLFVVLAGSWAITALPQVIAPANNSTGFGGGGGKAPVPTSSSSPQIQGSGVPVGTSGQPRPSSTPSCTPGTSGSPSPSVSPSTTPSPTSSASPSPTTSATGSPSPTTSPTGSPSPTTSPTDSSSPGPSPGSTTIAAPAGGPAAPATSSATPAAGLAAGIAVPAGLRLTGQSFGQIFGNKSFRELSLRHQPVAKPAPSASPSCRPDAVK